MRQHHGHDESPLSPASPDAVAFPESTQEVARILEICSRERVPVVPFGAGTSLEGHVLAIRGGLCLDLNRMDDVVAVNVDDLDVTVQPGVRRRRLNELLGREGMFFPVDPGADATIGGMVATGASGTTTVRYGAMKENVLALEVVLPSGQIVRTARRARKSAAGYDLTHLFLGSEGTLGVITEVTLRIQGIPECIGGALCDFPSVDAAVRAVVAILQSGISVARAELMDAAAVAASNRYSSLELVEAPTLLFEFHGSTGAVAEDTSAVADICKGFGASAFRSAIDAGERKSLWRARHDSFYASLALRSGSRAITTDVCVPISRLAECITETENDIARNGLTTTIVGHVGDGNFHVVVLVDPEDPDEMQTAERFNDRLVQRALSFDGTCTGEHGIGLRKVGFLERELPDGVAVMRSVKDALDPLGIMNPGKVLGGDARRYKATLEDGTEVVFRLIGPDDKEMLIEAFHRLSDESRYERFLSNMKTLTREQLRYLTEVDHHNHSAWIVVARTDKGPRGAAVGRWVRLPDEPGVAEVALTVVDEFQRQGLGRTLLYLCASNALPEGIAAFRAVVLGENRATLGMLRHMSAAEKHWESGVLEVTVPLDEAVLRNDLVPLDLTPI